MSTQRSGAFPPGLPGPWHSLSAHSHGAGRTRGFGSGCRVTQTGVALQPQRYSEEGRHMRPMHPEEKWRIAEAILRKMLEQPVGLYVLRSQWLGPLCDVSGINEPFEITDDEADYLESLQ